jgi:hypothetical protein
VRGTDRQPEYVALHAPIQDKRQDVFEAQSNHMPEPGFNSFPDFPGLIRTVRISSFNWMDSNRTSFGFNA